MLPSIREPAKRTLVGSTSPRTEYPSDQRVPLLVCVGTSLVKVHVLTVDILFPSPVLLLQVNGLEPKDSCGFFDLIPGQEHGRLQAKMRLEERNDLVKR